MDATEKKTLYFSKPGTQNTNRLLEFVKDYVKKEGIRDIVVASTTGKTGAKASKIFKGYNVVVVTHCFGFKEPGKTELQEKYREEILKNGAKIFTGIHALSSAERAIRKDFGTIQPLELIANVLRLMGEGTKVCVEITLMAADAGLIPIDKDIIAIAGTGSGADTALRIKPVNAARFFDLKIKEIIAKPNGS
ncbi:MAG: pyruvate kinase alpha/beta domain-containing protein [Candidatus Bathyarchaeota archaeon]|nr:pyruvate kinase alpha/beta domain-containing protein [Candidatus Bathyarchaeota archaeon]MDI6805498.1 pyruvate kinase alpha/beta domain-containing protein [Candidatus Bathyarchaeia archaeon]